MQPWRERNLGTQPFLTTYSLEGLHRVTSPRNPVDLHGGFFPLNCIYIPTDSSKVLGQTAVRSTQTGKRFAVEPVRFKIY